MWIHIFRRSVAALSLSLAGLLISSPIAAQDPPEEESAALKLLETLGPKEEMGAWALPAIPSVEGDRTQAVHATLLPNGKVLIVNGSSLRLQATGNPLFPLNLVDNKNPEVTNNTAIFDPSQADRRNSGFTRIGSPPNPIDGKTNDLFCGGHLQTPNGDVLFVSGTDKYYFPPLQYWTGSVFANLFDWQNETWSVAGELEDGHWYPTLLPLADGRIMTISGWSSKMNMRGEIPVSSLMSPWLEFYDWTQPPESAWQAINAMDLPNSPFKVGLDHYPRIHAIKDGRFIIPGDGSGGGNKQSIKTFFMTVSGETDVSFELAAAKTVPRRIYGTAVVDPNSDGDMLLIGGQLATESALIGPYQAPNDPANAVTTQLERFVTPTEHYPQGRWEVVPNFIGDRQTDARSNHFATLLPTKQLLIMGGGMYRFYRPNFQPLLLSPKASAPGGYERQILNPGTQPRIYHNTALLLPDGRIFVAGGNASYAALEAQDDGSFDVRLDTHYQGPLPTFLDKGFYAIPAENYQIEFFYPPYLFSPGPRPEITDAPTTLTYESEHTISVSDMTEEASLVLIKLGSATHGWDMGQRLADLDFTQDVSGGEVTFTAPANRHLYPPAYYMLFYVNEIGYPSVAKIVQLKEAQ